eukprot:4272330-Prymnesium_polylepis.1
MAGARPAARRRRLRLHPGLPQGAPVHQGPRAGHTLPRTSTTTTTTTTALTPTPGRIPSPKYNPFRSITLTWNACAARVGRFSATTSRATRRRCATCSSGSSRRSRGPRRARCEECARGAWARTGGEGGTATHTHWAWEPWGGRICMAPQGWLRAGDGGDCARGAEVGGRRNAGGDAHKPGLYFVRRMSTSVLTDALWAHGASGILASARSR